MQKQLKNNKINNVEIYARHKYLSLFTEGSYDINTEDAHIHVWGKYNKNAQKGIKILFIPLSMLTKIVLRPEHTKDLYQTKLDKIPPIEAKPTEEEAFTVRMTGNLNDNSTIKVELKSIK